MVTSVNPPPPARNVLQQVAAGALAAGLACAVAATTQPLPDPRTSCHCLCGVHSLDGAFCTMRRQMWVELDSQTLGPLKVPMCGPCGDWWRQHRPHRVLGVDPVV